MPSAFAWIDHSERQRRKVLDAISLFSEQGTVDELGIGTIRDAIADLLFPGTTSIQTRARYFFFIPWMYRDLERRKVPARDIAAKARRYEVGLIDLLLKNQDAAGTIGKHAKATLHRLPSNIYWSGLRKLGILVFHGSQEEYHRAFERFHGATARIQRNDDGEVVGELAISWHLRLPEPPVDFPRAASFVLTREEAKYLKDRIRVSHGDSLFAFLVNHLGKRTDLPFPWNHPLVSDGQLTTTLAEQLAHARRFSQVMHGAALLYNLMLSQEARRDQLAWEYGQQLASWEVETRAAQHELHQWDLPGFWRMVRSSDATRRPLTEHFVEQWIGMARQSAAQAAGSDMARDLIRERERTLKRSLARLGNPRALELWQGASSAYRLDFRWRNAEQILNDMLNGLEGGPRA